MIWIKGAIAQSVEKRKYLGSCCRSFDEASRALSADGRGNGRFDELKWRENDAGVGPVLVLHEARRGAWGTDAAALNAHFAAVDGHLASLKEARLALAMLYAPLSDEQGKGAEKSLTA